MLLAPHGLVQPAIDAAAMHERRQHVLCSGIGRRAGEIGLRGSGMRHAAVSQQSTSRKLCSMRVGSHLCSQDLPSGAVSWQLDQSEFLAQTATATRNLHGHCVHSSVVGSFSTTVETTSLHVYLCMHPPNL